MRKIIVLAALAGALVPVAGHAEADRVNVAFDAMQQGRTADAVDALKSLRAEDRDDPAVLINLGTAYARQGKYDLAEAMFTAAMTSGKRYDLELADGSWLDSREAARRGLERLKQQRTVAMR